MRACVLGVVVVVVSCGHGPVTSGSDASVASDARAADASDGGALCRSGDPGPDTFGECVTHYGGAWCSDVLERPVCTGGTWACPEGTSLTSPSNPCACYGEPPPGRTCLATGLSCGDAALYDAGSP